MYIRSRVSLPGIRPRTPSLLGCCGVLQRLIVTHRSWLRAEVAAGTASASRTTVEGTRRRIAWSMPPLPAGPSCCDHGGMTSVEEIAQLLGKVHIFAGMSERDLAQLAQVAVPRAYLEGESIFREGDKGDTCYVVRSGGVRGTRRHSVGRLLT